jgi:hypothetical protein
MLCGVGPYDVRFGGAEEMCSTLRTYSWASQVAVIFYAMQSITVEVVSLNKSRIEEFSILEYNVCSPPKDIWRFGGTYRLYLQSRRSKKPSCYRFHAALFLGLFFNPEVGGSTFLRNVSPIFRVEDAKTRWGSLCWFSPCCFLRLSPLSFLYLGVLVYCPETPFPYQAGIVAFMCCMKCC